MAKVHKKDGNAHSISPFYGCDGRTRRCSRMRFASRARVKRWATRGRIRTGEFFPVRASVDSGTNQGRLGRCPCPRPQRRTAKGGCRRDQGRAGEEAPRRQESGNRRYLHNTADFQVNVLSIRTAVTNSFGCAVYRSLDGTGDEMASITRARSGITQSQPPLLTAIREPLNSASPGRCERVPSI